MKNLFSFVILLFSCLIFSCSNVFEENESKGSENAENIPVVSGCVTVYGSVTPFNEAVPSDSIENDSGARAAGVNFQVLPYAYYVYGVKSSGEKVDGNVETDGTEKKYTISLPYGTWTIYVGAKVDDVKVLEDSFSCTLTEDANTLNHSFTLKPKQTESGSGKIYLLTESPDSVANCSIICSDENFKNNVSYTNKYITSGTNSVKSGNYTVQLDFYDSTNTKLLYSTVQGINVYDGFTTAFWISNDGNSLISNGNLTITQEMIDNFATQTYYVDGTNSTGTGSGTWVKPFAKVSEALGKISDTSKNYTIYVNGEIAEDSTLAIGIKKVTIKSKNVSSPATIKRGSNRNKMISLDSAGTLTLNGIIIDGDPDGNSGTITDSGAGIFSSGTLTLKNVTVKNCKTENYDCDGIAPQAFGGGLCVNSGSAEIEGGSFENCTADQGGGIFNNGSLSVTNCKISSCLVTVMCDGGGIYNKAGYTVNLKGTSSIENCTASLGSGGGIYNEGNCNLYDTVCVKNCGADKNGGGIYNSSSGSLAMNSTSSIFGCHADKGGGIYNEGTSSMNDTSSVSGCYASDSDSGGGIYNEGTSSMNDTSSISNCTAGYGGGIYNTSICNITGGEIKRNTGTSGGGGIRNTGTLNLSGGTLSSNTGSAGSDISQNGIMNMSGSASVSDELYLWSGKTVAVSGLSGNYGAKINYGEVASGKTVLTTTDSAASLTSYLSNFTMIDSENYGIAQLNPASDTYAVLTRNIYVAGSNKTVLDGEGLDSNNGTKSKPYASVGKALSKIVTKYDQILVDGTTLEGSQLSIASGKNCKITRVNNATAIIKRYYTTANSFINNAGTLTLDNVTVDGNGTSLTSVNGAGINNSGTLSLNNATIQNCVTSTNGGGIYSTSSNLTFTNAEITGNSAQCGGGLYLKDVTTAVSLGSGSSIYSNTYGAKGGGVYLNGSKFNVSGGSIYLNDLESGSSSGMGGGIYNGSSSTLAVSGGSIYGNSSGSAENGGSGGGIYNDNSSSLNVSGGEIKNNSARFGGAVANNNLFDFSGGTIGATADSAMYGKGIHQNGTLNMSGTATVSNNDDIYLPTVLKTVNVSGSVNSGAACLTPATWPTSGESAALLSGTASNYLNANNTNKFKASDSDYYVNYDGKVVKLLSPTVSSEENLVCALNQSLTSSQTQTITVSEDIEINSTISITGKRTIQANGSDVTIKRTADFSRNVFSLSNSATLTLGGGSNKLTIDGGSGMTSSTSDYSYSSIASLGYGTAKAGRLIDVSSGTTVNISTNTEISHFYSSTDCGAVAYVLGTLNMTGGTISYCKAPNYGGAIYVKQGTFNMSGGSIMCCSAPGGYAGAIYIESGMVNISDSALIKGNYSRLCGAIFLQTGTGQLTMSGGEICYNYETANNSNAGGGGIRQNGGTLTITGGKIDNNHAEYGNGGGIRVNGGTFSLGQLSYVYDNTNSNTNNIFVQGGNSISCTIEGAVQDVSTNDYQYQ